MSQNFDGTWRKEGAGSMREALTRLFCIEAGKLQAEGFRLELNLLFPVSGLRTGHLAEPKEPMRLEAPRHGSQRVNVERPIAYR
jgi:hypothetical protein